MLKGGHPVRAWRSAGTQVWHSLGIRTGGGLEGSWEGVSRLILHALKEDCELVRVLVGSCFDLQIS